MKALSLIIFLSLFISLKGLNAAEEIKGEKAATLFYIVNLDDQMLDVFKQVKAKTDDASASDNKIEVTSGVIDSIYAISSDVFKDDLGLELLPLNELQNKVKYNSQFPNCPNEGNNIKKAVKNATGYKFYVDFFVNIYSGLNPSPNSKVTAKQIRPLYAISFTIYNKSGNVTLKKEFTYRSNDTLADNKKGKKITEQDIMSKLYNTYRTALREFTSEYKVASL